VHFGCVDVLIANVMAEFWTFRNLSRDVSGIHACMRGLYSMSELRRLRRQSRCFKVAGLLKVKLNAKRLTDVVKTGLKS